MVSFNYYNKGYCQNNKMANLKKFFADSDGKPEFLQYGLNINCIIFIYSEYNDKSTRTWHCFETSEDKTLSKTFVNSIQDKGILPLTEIFNANKPFEFSSDSQDATDAATIQRIRLLQKAIAEQHPE